MARPGTGNRIGLALVGLVALVAGLTGLARGLDLWPRVLGEAEVPVLEQRVRDAAGQGWFWPVVAVTLVALALLSLWWLAAQSQRRTIRGLRLEPDPRRGGTTVPARAVTSAFTEDLAAESGLRRVRAAMIGNPGRPELAVTGTLPPDADPVVVKHRLYQALGRHRQALDSPRLPASLRLH